MFNLERIGWGTLLRVVGFLVFVGVVISILGSQQDIIEDQRDQANRNCETAIVNRIGLRDDVNATADLGISLTKANRVATPQQKAASIARFETYRKRQLAKLPELPDCEHKTYQELEDELLATAAHQPAEPPVVAPSPTPGLLPTPARPGTKTQTVTQTQTRTVIKRVAGPVRVVYRDRHVHHHHVVRECYQGKKRVSCR